MSRKSATLALFLLALLLVGCGGTSTTVSNPNPLAPAITTQPTAKTVTVGQTATFMMVAGGTTPLSYQWQKDTTPIPGATAASYTTPPTTLTDSG